MVALEAGDVTAFLAVSDDPEVEAADPALVGEVVYTGANGEWLVSFDASQLTVAVMDENGYSCGWRSAPATVNAFSLHRSDYVVQPISEIFHSLNVTVSPGFGSRLTSY